VCVGEYADDLEASGLFEPVTIVSRHWRSSHPTDEWLSLLQTHSDHRMLAEDVRAALLERVRHAVDAHGARVDVDYDAVAILTKRLAR
jgi:Zn-finger domain-containing protein